MGAQQGHEGKRRKLSKLKKTDTVVPCVPSSLCPCCGDSHIAINQKPSYRHQVHEIPEPIVNITEYQVFHGRCQNCQTSVKGKRPQDTPQGIMGPNLMSYIALLAGQFHLSVRKIQELLKLQLGTSFSTGAISEAQGKVSSMLTPLHQAVRDAIQKAPMVHIDETSHIRNGESSLRWCWLMSSDDWVYERVLFSRSTHSAKVMLNEKFAGVVISDQCASYNWLNPEKHQFCLGHLKRNLQQMADYSGGGLTAFIGKRLTLLINMIFRTQHCYEEENISAEIYFRRMKRLRKSLTRWLHKGADVTTSRYSGRCKFILKHEVSLWVFLTAPLTIPLTNNEAERRLRGSVIMRKISFGTSSDRGDKFRGRIHTLVETCKKRSMSPFIALQQIVNAVVKKQPYPDIFNLCSG
ncbi:IS66 family transposase [Photobacterium profundum]|uniref:IS66 family transposase n=1 Tax=Photobacterium profundum TaxID=74109 RepID=UPI002F3F944A